MRRAGLLAFVVLFAACEAPQVVDCTSAGRFVEAGGDHWCLYARGRECPRLLPVEHRLPWGGFGCASREHDPLPSDLCVAAGRCSPDGGS